MVLVSIRISIRLFTIALPFTSCNATTRLRWPPASAHRHPRVSSARAVSAMCVKCSPSAQRARAIVRVNYNNTRKKKRRRRRNGSGRSDDAVIIGAHLQTHTHTLRCGAVGAAGGGLYNIVLHNAHHAGLHVLACIARCTRRIVSSSR